MNDYSVTASTVLNDADLVREQSASETIREIRKELNETILCLSNIELSLCGEQGKGRTDEEPASMIDELRLIEHMAMDCIALSHRIHEKLFYTGSR